MKKKRKVLATWKVILIVIASIIGLMGVTTLAMYLLGYLNEEVVNPNDISFVQDENYNAESGMYEVAENFELTITSSTAGVTVNDVTLSLSGGVAENGYIDNGIIIVPEKVKLNTPFQVTLSSSYNETLETNWINGGITTLKATSSYGLIQPVSTYIAVDVPVDSITAYLYDVADSEMNKLNNIIVGSQFKVKIDYSPEESEKLYSGDENKMVFYYSLYYNDISFDPETQTFTAEKISEADGDKITIYTFSSAKYQKEFLAQYNQYLAENPSATDNFETMNQRANLYFGEKPEACKKYDISLKVVDVTVDNFRLTNTDFKGTVDKYLNLASSSTSPVFDGNLGVIIRDSENTPLNSVYAKNVGIAYMGQNDGVKIVGSSVIKVVETTLDGEKSYNITQEVYSEGVDYRMSISEDGTQRTYYFILPDTNGSSDASNYSYKISASEDNVEQFKTALFIEENGELVIYLNAGQTFDDLPVVNIDFTMSVEAELYWDEQSSINLVYDSDAGISDSVDLSTQIHVDEDNIYQTVRYFFFFEGGSLVGDFNAISSKAPVEYTVSGTDPDIILSIPGSSAGVNSIYLYELNDSMLTANGPYQGNIYLIFVTVRTDADGNVIMQDGKYDIVLSSNARTLVIDSTLKFSDMNSTLDLTSVSENYFLYDEDGDDQNYELYLPSVLYTTNDEAVKDTFNFNITLSNSLDVNADLNEMQDLFNSQNLRIEFRGADGKKSDYISLSNATFEFNEVASTVTISGNVEISNAYSNVEGEYFTAYLIFNNGKVEREKQITLNYAGLNFNNFYLYSQSVNDAQYRFMLEEDNPYLDIDGDPAVINVRVTADEVSILWNGNPVVDGQGGNAISTLSNLLQVAMFDQYGREILVSSVASYTLQEKNGLNYIMISNNNIVNFSSTGGKPVDTVLNAVANSKDGAEVETIDIQFNIQSEGVSKIEYDGTLFAKMGEDDEMTTITEGNLGEVTIEKYLEQGDEIILANLINVYIGDSDTPMQSAELNFKLDSSYLNEMSSTSLNDLFRPAEALPSVGMIALYNTDTELSDINLVDYDNDTIKAFKIQKPFAQETTLVFNVTDANNLVNIQLKFVIYANVEVTNKFSTYENNYEGYLTDNGMGELRIKVFGNDTLDLNTYLPISYIMTQDGEALSWSNGNLNISTETKELVSLNGSSLTFADVKTFQTVNVTISYGTENTFSFKMTLSFIINPNYAIVQSNNFIDISTLTSSGSDISLYYDIYRAIDYINYVKNSASLDESSKIGFDDFNFTTISGIIEIKNDSTLITRKESAVFESNLGENISSSCTLTYAGPNAGTGDFKALYFIAATGEENPTFVGSGVSTISFEIGYGKDAYDTIDKIFGESNTNYKLIEDETGYKLILLEGETYYPVQSDSQKWQASTDSRFVVCNATEFIVSSLEVFNLDIQMTFTCNNIDIIKVNARLTKVGLDYVVYTNDYTFDVITGNPNILVENNVYEEMTAGVDKKQVVFVDTYEDGEEPSKEVGFHYKSTTGSSANIAANLSVYDITDGYDDLISITGSASGLQDSIKINSVVDADDEIYAILQLTLTQNMGSGTISYEMYFRIKITANYSLGSVTYPYNDSAEYINETDFSIDFEEAFGVGYAAGNAVGKTRFAKLQDKTNGEFVETPARYSIYEVSINGEVAVSEENWKDYITLTLDEETGLLSASVKNPDAIIEIKIAKTYYETILTGLGNEIINSQRIYRIILNNTPEYIANVYKVNGEDETPLSTEGEDFVDNIEVGNKDYKYLVDLKMDNGGDTQTPETNMFAHFTSQMGMVPVTEKILAPFVKEGDSIYSTYVDGTLSDEYKILASDFNDGTDRIFATLTPIEGDTVVKVTFAEGSTKNANLIGKEFYMQESLVNFFMFKQKEGSTNFELTFRTIAANPYDLSFSIGIYTAYENVFDINFNVNGGYTYTLTENVVSGNAFESGTKYNLDDFVTSIYKNGDTTDIKENFEYTILANSAKAEEKISIDKTSGVTFVVAYTDEDFDAQINAVLKVGEDTVYEFTFFVHFTKSFDSSLVYEFRDETNYYSQHTININLESGNLTDKIAEWFDIEEGIRSDIDSLIFTGDGTTKDITIPNVSEEQTNTENLSITYLFNEKEIFSFNVNYVYTVLPNVELKVNYPMPDGETETTKTVNDEAVKTEYVDNKTTINDFFNTAPNFTAKAIEKRLEINPMGQTDGAPAYSYTIGLNVTSISNVNLNVTGNTIKDMTAPGNIMNTTTTTPEMPEYNFKFNLVNNSISGSVEFSITVNQVTITYNVTVSNTETVTVETNATNRTNSVENIYAEDMKNYTELTIFGNSRLLKYRYLTGISLNSYFVRFENEQNYFVYELQSTTLGVDNIEELGRSYSGYTFEGVYKAEVDAENKSGKLDAGTIFAVNPYVTNRIVLKYAGYEVSPTIANVYIQDGSTWKDMTTFTFASADIGQEKKLNIGYNLTRDTYGTEPAGKTNYSYTVALKVEFEVVADAETEFEELQAGSTYNLLSMSGFGIRNARTGELYNQTTLAENGAIDLQVYGFSDLKVEEDGDELSQEAYRVDQKIRAEVPNSTGINPRAGGHELNTGVSGDLTNNYISLTAIRSNDKNVNWTIRARGASNLGNYVMMKITYSTTFGEVTVKTSYNLRVKVVSSYTVQIMNDNITNAYSNAQSKEYEKGKGGHTLYMTNTAENPYIINLTGDSLTINLYSSGNNSVLVANQGGQNLGNLFTYYYAKGSAGAEFNSYEAGVNFADFGWNCVYDGEDDETKILKEASKTGSGGVNFGVKTVELGDKNYYIDAVDSYGFQIRIYFRIKSTLNPEIVGTNKSSVTEGDSVTFGTLYNTITQNKITLSGTTAKEEKADYNQEYDFYFANVSKIDSKAVTVYTGKINDDNKVSGTDVSIVYVYNGTDGKKYATKDATNAELPSVFDVYVDIISPEEIVQPIIVTYGDATLTPSNQSVSEVTNPTFGEGDYQITLRGFDTYLYINGDGIIGTSSNDIYESNFYKYAVSKISYEINGEQLKTYQEDKRTSNLYTREGASYYWFDETHGYRQSVTQDLGDTPFSIPYFDGSYYGTSTSIEVVMVITITDGTSEAELRLNVTVNRKEPGTIKTSKILDGGTITNGDFNSASPGEVTVYNDTLQIQTTAGTSLKYAITTDTKIPDDNEQDVNNPWKTINNTRSYTHSDYVRISTEKAYTAGNTYYVHIKDVSEGGSYTIKYFDSVKEATNSNEIKSYNIGKLAAFSATNIITYNIESIAELNSSGYATRNIYTVVGYRPNESTGPLYYQQHESIQVYPYYKSISANNSTAYEYIVNNYYKVEGGNTGTADDYYVISPSGWAVNSLLNYVAYDPSFMSSSHYIGNEPWAYSFEIEGNATIDATGTITTSKGFDVKTNTIKVTIYMKVSGADGMFRDNQGLLLGTVEFYLREYSGNGSQINGAKTGYNLLGNSLIVLNDKETLYMLGSGLTTTVKTPAQGEASPVIIVPMNTTINFGEYFGTDEANTQYRIVQENTDGAYIISNNVDSYTYDSVGSYTSTFVKSYLNSEKRLTFEYFTATVVVYDNESLDYRSYALTKGSTANSISTVLNDGGGYTYYQLKEDGSAEAKTTFDVAKEGITTYNIVAVKGSTIINYNITIFVYSDAGSKDVALTPNTTYYLSNLFGNDATTYKLSADNKNQVVPSVIFQSTNTAPQPETYYVQTESGVKKYTVNYYVYNSNSNIATSTWLKNSDFTTTKVDDKDVTTATLTLAQIKNILKVEGSEKIYALSDNNEMVEITESKSYTLERKETDAANSLTRQFFVVNTKDGVSNYTKYTITFFVYQGETNIASSTVYTNAYRLSNLDSLVLENLGLTGTVSWYTYGGNALSSISTLTVDTDSVVDGIYKVNIVREDGQVVSSELPVFYVMIGGKYYKVTLTLYSAIITNSFNIMLNRTITAGNNNLSNYTEQINANINVTGAKSAKFYVINNNIPDGKFESGNYKLTETTTVTFPSQNLFAIRQKYLYVVTYNDGASDSTIYAIINVTFVGQNGTTEETMVSENLMFESSTDTKDFNLNLITSSVRTELGISQVEYYDDSSNIITNNILSLDDNDVENDYILKSVNVKTGTEEDGSLILTKILVLIENNIPSASEVTKWMFGFGYLFQLG